MIEFEETYGKKLFPGDIRGLLSLPDVVGVLPLEDDLAEAYASEVESLLTGRSEAHVVDGQVLKLELHRPGDEGVDINLPRSVRPQPLQ